ncbi:4a-hydroxytetrahydrobiopterin dehydratase [Streptomyces iconiensis]|uniref:Putative pterin-4-alpha-carbinolamine dehydratase n=1 Tax=Streptomyces iconiensis TaxID=1384038 RepID=A0ABT7A6X5_9ACTN|nr:4a-hydroxytetrahydrobiopterin dehydratase [Streptomyces iconiensis]MDJ1137071.1 4a-hydroxytetrahydrobiopterin dehydratase [Streptomyces iconiensis]
MAERDPLSVEAVADHLSRWDGWEGDTARIHKTFALDFYESTTFLADLVEPAHRLRHQPDIDLRWGKLTISLTTYSSDAVVTELDFKLVAEIERVAAAHGAAAVE